MNIHTCSKPCVMHSDTFDFMLHKETAPTVMNGLAVWQKFKVPFYFPSNHAAFRQCSTQTHSCHPDE